MHWIRANYTDLAINTMLGGRKGQGEGRERRGRKGRGGDGRRGGEWKEGGEEEGKGRERSEKY